MKNTIYTFQIKTIHISILDKLLKEYLPVRHDGNIHLYRQLVAMFFFLPNYTNYKCIAYNNRVAIIILYIKATHWKKITFQIYNDNDNFIGKSPIDDSVPCPRNPCR